MRVHQPVDKKGTFGSRKYPFMIINSFSSRQRRPFLSFQVASFFRFMDANKRVSWEVTLANPLRCVYRIPCCSLAHAMFAFIHVIPDMRKPGMRAAFRPVNYNFPRRCKRIDRTPKIMIVFHILTVFIFPLAAFLTVEGLAQIFFCENSERITHIQRQLEIGQIGNIFPPNPTFGAGM